jgi:hypothetical protein
VRLPFTPDQFLEVFARYNTSIWPVHLVAYLLGVAALILANRKTPYSDRAVSGILALYWLWMGIAYHWLHFAAINRAAYVFGALFVLQGILLAWLGAVRQRLVFGPGSRGASVLGGLLAAYAMVVYPLIGSALGHGYPRSPSFGVAPCPTTIFTFALLLWTEKRVPVALLVVPLVWSVIASGAALSLGIREDIGLLVAGLIALAHALSRRWMEKSSDRGTWKKPL